MPTTSKPIVPTLPKLRRLKKTRIARFEEKFIPEPNSGCWLWIGAVAMHGYGRFLIGNGVIVYAHRFSYQAYKGPLTQGLEIDHVCRMRCCVNPDHLEQVSHHENMRRSEAHQTHCKYGHAWTERNTWINPRQGWRQCRICLCARQKATQARKRQRLLEASL